MNLLRSLISVIRSWTGSKYLLTPCVSCDDIVYVIGCPGPTEERHNNDNETDTEERNKEGVYNSGDEHTPICQLFLDALADSTTPDEDEDEEEVQQPAPNDEDETEEDKYLVNSIIIEKRKKPRGTLVVANDHGWSPQRLVPTEPEILRKYEEDSRWWLGTFRQIHAGRYAVCSKAKAWQREGVSYSAVCLRKKENAGQCCGIDAGNEKNRKWRNMIETK